MKTPQAAPVLDQKQLDAKKSYEYIRDRDRQKVKGIFSFYEVPGGSMSFVYRKYKGDQIERYDMVDGMVYEVPLCVAKHLNNDVWYPIHGFLQDENGMPKQHIAQRVSRCGFQSLEFINEDGFNSSGPTRSVISVTSM